VWISWFRSSTERPPVRGLDAMSQSQLTTITRRGRRAEPEAAAAAGFTVQDVQQLVGRLQNQQFVAGLFGEGTPPVSGGSPNGLRDRAESAVAEACMLGGISVSARNNLRRCTRAVDAGASLMGLVCRDARSQGLAARSLISEQRAARLGRQIDSNAAAVLDQIAKQRSSRRGESRGKPRGDSSVHQSLTQG